MRSIAGGAASELSADDRLLGHDGCWVPLDGIELSDTWSVVYNLRVAEDHTYFVGCDDWGFSLWAHNMCTPEEAARYRAMAADESLHPMARLAAKEMADDFAVRLTAHNAASHEQYVRSLIRDELANPGDPMR